MKIPLVYNVRSVLQRPVSTAFTALGIALVVAVFIGMLALANGFRTALVRTGSDRNLLVLRRGADSELSSGLSREVASILAAAPHVATGADGKPLVSPEVYVLVPLPKIFDTTQVANVVARGVGDQAWTVRSNVRVVEGRKPETGRSEICVGRRLVARFPHTGIGETLRFAGRDWTVVCHFTAGGSAFESEVWGDVDLMQPAFQRNGYQSVTLKLANDYPRFKRICARHGIEISATRVRKVVKHFEAEREKTRAWRKILEQTTSTLLRQSAQE